MRKALCSLSILAIPVFVNAPSFAKGASPFESVVAKIRSHGQDTGVFHTGLANMLGLLDGDAKKTIAVSADRSTDHLAHEAILVSRSSVPVCVLLAAQERAGLATEARFYRMDNAGRLVRADIISGRYDAEGKPVPNSAHSQPLDIKKRAVQRAYRHELAFWLKGKYRKHPGDVLNRPRTSTTTEPATPQSMPGPHVSKP